MALSSSTTPTYRMAFIINPYYECPSVESKSENEIVAASVPPFVDNNHNTKGLGWDNKIDEDCSLNNSSFLDVSFQQSSSASISSTTSHSSSGSSGYIPILFCRPVKYTNSFSSTDSCIPRLESITDDDYLDKLYMASRHFGDFNRDLVDGTHRWIPPLNDNFDSRFDDNERSIINNHPQKSVLDKYLNQLSTCAILTHISSVDHSQFQEIVQNLTQNVQTLPYLSPLFKAGHLSIILISRPLDDLN